MYNSMTTVESSEGREVLKDGKFSFWRPKGDDAGEREVLLGLIFACDNPECECQEVEVRVAAFDEKALVEKPPFQSHLFSIDLQTAMVKSLDDSQPAEMDNHLREWLVQESDPEFLDALHDQFLLAKGFVRRKKPRLPAHWDPNDMVPWPTLIPGTREDRYPMDGQIYLVVDNFCLNPRCSCSEILMSFIEFEVGAPRAGEEVGGARVALPDLQITGWEPFTRSEETLTKVFQAHKERYGERLLSLLEERRRQSRALGRKLVRGHSSQSRKRKAKRRRKKRR